MVADKRGTGCLALFGLPFAAVGLLMFGLIGTQLYQWGQMQSWTPTEASILELDLEENQSSEGGKTFKVTANYSYQVGNITYYSDKVYLGFGADNIGSFHEDKYRELSQKRAKGEKATCHFNPDNPEDAILFPELRTGMLLLLLAFGVVFGGAGFLMLFFSYGGKSSSASSPVVAAEEDVFKTSQFSSRSTVVKSKTSATVWVALGVTLFTALFSIPVCFLVYEEVSQNQEYGFLLMLLFPVTTVISLRWFLITWARHRRFKGTELLLRRAPVRIGERLSGTIRIPTDIGQATVKLTLLCSKREVSQSAGKTVYSYQDMLKFEASAFSSPSGMNTSSVEVSFEIPKDAHPSLDAGLSSDGYFWRLTASAEIPGADFWAEFELNVAQALEEQPPGD